MKQKYIMPSHLYIKRDHLTVEWLLWIWHLRGQRLKPSLGAHPGSDGLYLGAAIIDSVLGFDYASGALSYQLADDILAYIAEQDFIIDWLIETHVHADHLSAAPYLQQKIGGKIAISKHIVEVQKIFGKVFNAGTAFERDGRQFDRLLEDQDSYEVGSLQGRAIHTPGHTPACMAHIIGDAIFVGDTLFMPDGGTARADFPGASDYQVLQR